MISQLKRIVCLVLIILYISELNCIAIEKKKEADKPPNVFNSQIRLLRETKNVKDMLSGMLKKGGLFENDGFITLLDKQQNSDQESLTLSRCFDTYKDLAEETKRQQQKRGKGPLKEIQDAMRQENGTISSIYVVMNFMIDPATRAHAIDWLEEKIEEGIDSRPGVLKRCKAHLIVEYNCCVKSFIPELSPQYASLKIRIG